MEIKDIIRSNRLTLGLTMKEVADMVGVSEATISRWESGDIENMKRDKISALAKTLHIPLEVLMGWEDDPDAIEASTIKAEIERLSIEIAKLKEEESEIIERLLKSKYKDRVLEYAKKYIDIEELEE